MITLKSFLTSLGLDPAPSVRRGRSRPSAVPTPAQRRAAEAASVAHLPGPTSRPAPPPPPRGREVVPSITMDSSTVKWHPDGRIHFRPGIPADLGVVRGPLTNRKITEYEKQGKYGLEAKRRRDENDRLKKLRGRTPRTPSAAEEWVRTVLGL